MILSDCSQDGQDLVVLPPKKDDTYKADTHSNKPNQSVPLQLNTPQGSIRPQETAEAIKARNRIAVLRGRVVLTRIGNRTQRTQVQQLRQKTIDAEAELLKALDAFMLQDGVEKLRGLYEKVRIARDELGPAIAEYEEIEDKLNQQEYQLEEEEEQFYQLCGIEDDYVRDERVLAQT